MFTGNHRRDGGGYGLTSSERTKLTPPQLAKRWGISPEKVIAWIKRGELAAIDVSATRGGRPRYRIDETDIADFEQSRRVVTELPRPSPRKPRGNDTIEFF